MTPEEAVQKLNEIGNSLDGPGVGHKRADAVLLHVVPKEVAEAWFMARSRLDGTWPL